MWRMEECVWGCNEIMRIEELTRREEMGLLISFKKRSWVVVKGR